MSWDWESKFDERQRKEIEFCRVYDTNIYRHGATGHNNMLIISTMADLLTMYEHQIREFAGKVSEYEKEIEYPKVARGGFVLENIPGITYRQGKRE